MLLKQSFIEKILASANIVEVVQGDLQLTKAGDNYKACCPFHAEKSPSFQVSQSRQIFKCFGCGEGGNVIRYVMLRNRLTFPEAVKSLAERLAMPLEYEGKGIQPDPAEAKSREAIHTVNQLATRYFALSLPEAKDAMEYLGARLTPEDIATWHIGYAPDGWQGLLDFFRSQHVLEEAFLASGLIREHKSRGTLYDFFRGRIIFPIHDLLGRVIAFGGRSLQTDEKVPKYMNSPETPLYSKSNVLYGLNQATHSIREKKSCNLVEGYTDVIALHRIGITNTVGACGTSVTTQQLALIAKYCQHLNIIADGDWAGQKSTLRSGDLALSLGFKVTTTLLPKGDPDNLVKHFECQHL